MAKRIVKIGETILKEKVAEDIYFVTENSTLHGDGYSYASEEEIAGKPPCNFEYTPTGWDIMDGLRTGSFVPNENFLKFLPEIVKIWQQENLRIIADDVFDIVRK